MAKPRSSLVTFRFVCGHCGEITSEWEQPPAYPDSEPLYVVTTVCGKLPYKDWAKRRGEARRKGTPMPVAVTDG